MALDRGDSDRPAPPAVIIQWRQLSTRFKLAAGSGPCRFNSELACYCVVLYKSYSIWHERKYAADKNEVHSFTERSRYALYTYKTAIQ